MMSMRHGKKLKATRYDSFLAPLMSTLNRIAVATVMLGLANVKEISEKMS